MYTYIYIYTRYIFLPPLGHAALHASFPHTTLRAPPQHQAAVAPVDAGGAARTLHFSVYI